MTINQRQAVDYFAVMAGTWIFTGAWVAAEASLWVGMLLSIAGMLGLILVVRYASRHREKAPPSRKYPCAVRVHAPRIRNKNCTFCAARPSHPRTE